MDMEVKNEQDFRKLVALLTKENKQYVIAVANALLYTQKRGKSELRLFSECSS
ncbi:MAG: hypothetical protein HFJ04_12270 [Lachnospiraceae bacterium]|nr:hypothetical protein [Lachnospiraceae bacterium]